MIRYTKQRDRYSCGPVAILNMLRFFSKNEPYSNLKTIQNLVNQKTPNGTNWANFDRGLRKYFHVRKPKDVPNTREIRNHIKSGIPAVINSIVQYRKIKFENFTYLIPSKRHYWLVVDYNRTSKRYCIINYFAKGSSKRWVSESQFRKLIDNNYRCWFVYGNK